MALFVLKKQCHGQFKHFFNVAVTLALRKKEPFLAVNT